MADRTVKIRIDSEANEEPAKRINRQLGILQENQKAIEAKRASFMTAAQAEVAEVERLVNRYSRLNEQSAKVVKSSDEIKRSIDAIRQSSSDLANKISAAEFAYYDLDRAMKANTATIKGNKTNQAELDVARARAIQIIRELREEEQRAAAVSAKAARAKRDLGGAALEASRAFEDAQYGLRGVLNNIPGLIMMLGGSAGLAGAVSVGAVAMSIFAARVEKLQQEAKKAAENAGEMNDKLRQFLQTVEGDKLKTFVDDLENITKQEMILRETTVDSIETEEYRRTTLERVADALRDAAEQEIRLAEARGLISGDQANAQIAALKTEAEAAKQQSEIAAASAKTRQVEAQYNNKLAEIEAIRNEIKSLEDERDRAQQRSANLLKQANTLTDKDGNVLRASDAGALEQLRGQIAAADKSAAALASEIKQKAATIESQVAAASEVAQALDVAIERERILTDAVNRVAEISAESSVTQATAAVEKVRAGLESAIAEATARGEQLSQDQRAAFSTVSKALSDGIVSAQEMLEISNMFGRMSSDQRTAFNALGVNVSELQTMFAKSLTLLDQQKRANAELNAKLERIGGVTR